MWFEERGGIAEVLVTSRTASYKYKHLLKQMVPGRLVSVLCVGWLLQNPKVIPEGGPILSL